ncbi:MAG: KilA-N domain-containing protein [Candidatus Saccharibacteria bacterium]|nr:KilA-N domain-containing protein [Candidatus Saccharibacteria bacterium]
MFRKKRVLKVENNEISVKKVDGEDYISITDMIRNKDGDFFVSDWLRNRNTIEFLGIWESMNNPDFNYGEFAIIKSKVGLNNFKLSVKEWTEKTNAIGLKAVAGRYGGTYAQKDIAFEFGMWISPAFKLYLIKDYERLKEAETNQYQLEWDVRRVLASSTYVAHTDAVKEKIIPKVLPWRAQYQYADEADILNLAVFGITAADWRKVNPERVKRKENLRDSASIIELLILEELQLQNAEFIRKGMSKEERFSKLREMAISKRTALEKIDPIKGLKRLDDTTYLGDGKK